MTPNDPQRRASLAALWTLFALATLATCLSFPALAGVFGPGPQALATAWVNSPWYVPVLLGVGMVIANGTFWRVFYQRRARKEAKRSVREA